MPRTSFRGFLLASAGVMACLLLSLGSASASTTHPFAATWSLNEARGATIATDSSGYRHNGTIQPGVQVSGAGYYRFVGTGLVTVPMDWAGGLDPYTRDVHFAVTLRTTSRGGMNIVQKGQTGSPNGWWKLEVNQGHVACTFRGSAGVVGVWLTKFVNDGRWHSITCARIGNTVAAAVDYGTSNWQVNAVNRPTGDIHNGKQLTIGGKVACKSLKDGCDNFVGDIDRIQLWQG